MVQSPSWEANWFADSQETSRISRNPKVHYCTHKRPPPVSILGQPNPVHIHTSHLLEIHPNIIHPSTPRSLQWSPSLRFPTKTLYAPLSSPIRATCPAHLISDLQIKNGKLWSVLFINKLLSDQAWKGICGVIWGIRLCELVWNTAKVLNFLWFLSFLAKYGRSSLKN